MRGSRWIGIFGIASAGCGDPAVDGRYEGEALLKLNGLVCAIGEMSSSTTSIGVVWARLGQDVTLFPGESQPVDATYFPADFQLNVFDPPPPGAATAIRGPNGPVYAAIGIPVFFEDVDQDGVLGVSGTAVQGPDRLLGMARGQIILHAGVGAADAGEVQLDLPQLPSGYLVGKAMCDPQIGQTVLTGFEAVPNDTRVDVWLLDGVIDNPVEDLAPETCLSPFAPSQL